MASCVWAGFSVLPFSLVMRSKRKGAKDTKNAKVKPVRFPSPTCCRARLEALWLNSDGEITHE